MSNQVIVLGWDGLDYDLLEDWGLTISFGEYSREIETYDSPTLGVPHTTEIWPTIITGLSPSEHGITATTAEGSVEWENPLLNAASIAAQYAIPSTIRTWIGKQLLESGADVSDYRTDHFSENGIKTIFDERQSRPISLPNYHNEADERLAILSDRKDVWDGAFKPVREGEGEITYYEPLAETETIDEYLTSKLYKRLGIVESARERTYDLIFCWFGYLDTVGHLAPMMDEAGYQRRHYERAARITTQLRNEVSNDDVVISISDHGLRNGKHTHSPVIAADNEPFVNDVSSVYDFSAALDTHYPPTEQDGVSLQYSERSSDSKTEQSESATEVRNRLKDLGYLDS